MNNEVVTFKSTEENFRKEQLGIKPNTFRKIDLNDERFLKLIAMKVSGDYGLVRIDLAEETDYKPHFTRRITDVTIWDGYAIISWINSEELTNDN